MAVAFSSILGTGESDDETSLGIEVTGHVAGARIVVWDACTSTLGGVSSVTDDAGNTYTQVKVSSIANKRVSCWVSNGTAALSNGAFITVNRVGASGDAVACAVSYTGVTATEDSEGLGSGAVGPPSATWTVVAAGTLSLFGCAYITTVPAMSTPAGWTERYDIKHTVSSLCLSVGDTGSTPLTPGSNTLTLTEDTSNSSYNMITNSLRASGRLDSLPLLGVS